MFDRFFVQTFPLFFFLLGPEENDENPKSRTPENEIRRRRFGMHCDKEEEEEEEEKEDKDKEDKEDDDARIVSVVLVFQ